MTTHILEFAGIALAAATFPVALELALLTAAACLPRRKSVFPASASPARLAVLIPAHNEEALVARCVESLLVSAGESGTRIIAIAHNCTDRTALRAAQAGAEVLVYDNLDAKGKGSALLYGFEHVLASGVEAVAVVDADSTVSKNFIGVVACGLAEAGAVQCGYELEISPTRPKSRLTALAFRGFNLVRAKGRDRLGLSSGIFGNGFALRASVLAQTPYNAFSVVEDLEYHLQLVLAGQKVKFLDEATVSSCATNSAKGEITQRARWEGGRARVARRWMRPLLGQLIKGRLRLLEPILDLASLPLGYAVFLLLFALCAPLEWLRIYSALAIGTIGLHVLAAAWSGPDFAADLRVLSRAPGYVLWKLRILPRLFEGSRSNAGWVRTERGTLSGEGQYEAAKPLMSFAAKGNPPLR